MTTPKKRLTLTDVNKKVEKNAKITVKFQVINDVELRSITEHRSAVYQRLQNLEKRRCG